MIYVIFEKPTAEVNQHPMPELIGRLEHPEYLEGVCVTYNEFLGLTVPLKIVTLEDEKKLYSGRINLNDLSIMIIEDNAPIYDYINSFQDMKNNLISVSLLVDKNIITHYIEIEKDDWDMISIQKKNMLFDNISKFLNQQNKIYDIYLYTCNNGISKWTAYLSNK